MIESFHVWTKDSFFNSSVFLYGYNAFYVLVFVLSSMCHLFFHKR